MPSITLLRLRRASASLGPTYFSNIENLKKRLDNRAQNAPVPKIEQEMRRRLEEIFQPTKRDAYGERRSHFTRSRHIGRNTGM